MASSSGPTTPSRRRPADLQLIGDGSTWDHRRHLYAVATQAMRRVLVDFRGGRPAARREQAPVDELSIPF